jgi:uncharacterized protein involved in exopolysaccharide biosynthesis
MSARSGLSHRETILISIGPASASDRTILDDIVGIALRRKAVILLTALATVVAVYVTLLFVPETYEATSLLEVTLGRQNTELPAAVQKGSVYPSGVQREEINSDIQILKARESIEDVVGALGISAFRFEPPPPQTLLQHVKYVIRQTKTWAMENVTRGLIAMGLKKELTEREKVIAFLNNALDATREAESNVIRVSMRLPSRDVAEEALAVVVKSFIDKNPHLKTASSVIPILDAQVTADATELQDLQAEREKIMQQGGLSSVDRQRIELLQRLHKVFYERDDKKSQLAAAEARLAELTTYPIRLSMRDEIDQTNVQISGLRAGVGQDETNAEAINKTLGALNSAADSLELVNLRIEAVAKRFSLVTAQRDAAQVAQALDAGKILNVSVISGVGSAPEPVSPNKLRFLAIGAAGGLVLGIVLATLLEWGDDRIRGKDQISRASGLPYFGEFQLGPVTDPDALGPPRVQGVSMPPPNAPVR